MFTADFFQEIVLSLKFFVDYIRRKPYTHSSYKINDSFGNPKTDFGEAFGIHEGSRMLSSDEGISLGEDICCGFRRQISLTYVCIKIDFPMPLNSLFEVTVSYLGDHFSECHAYSTPFDLLGWLLCTSLVVLIVLVLPVLEFMNKCKRYPCVKSKYIRGKY
jgi:hypothetical protein